MDAGVPAVLPVVPHDPQLTGGDGHVEGDLAGTRPGGEVPGLVDGDPVDREPARRVAAHDVVPGQADEPFDEVVAGVLGSSPTLDRARGSGPRGGGAGCPRSQSPGSVKTTTSPRCRANGPGVSLETTTRSPTSRVCSMDPDGIQNTCSRNVLTTTETTTATATTRTTSRRAARIPERGAGARRRHRSTVAVYAPPVDLSGLRAQVDALQPRDRMWPAPHADRTPLQEEYSRCLTPGSTGAARAAAALGRRGGGAGAGRVEPARGAVWRDPFPEQDRATETPTATWWLRPWSTSALPLLVVAHGREGGVEVGAGDPAVPVVRLPVCGCDACDDGGALLAGELDDRVLDVLAARSPT